MTRKVPVKIRALLALNGKCEKKTRIFFAIPISTRTHSPSVHLRYWQLSSSVANLIFTITLARTQNYDDHTLMIIATSNFHVDAT